MIKFPCSEERGGCSSYRRGGAEVTRDDCRSRERSDGHMKWICCPERLQFAEVMLSPGIHVIEGHHSKQPQLVISGICRPVTAREISPACDLQLFRTESSIYVQKYEKEDLLTSCCLSRI
ncbi:hypothetical protein AV530_019582 [Patagioenas fasciata monilis]|uniref:Uncharacterized protein n=1 Tax=Patagioenas fasciata monilis TaxID=372326 RepID=A0A1V4JDV0_PATFA|nr:hypothetical protein AV530_019582 [Patagioenas fasciata monilis]